MSDIVNTFCEQSGQRPKVLMIQGKFWNPTFFVSVLVLLSLHLHSIFFFPESAPPFLKSHPFFTDFAVWQQSRRSILVRREPLVLFQFHVTVNDPVTQTWNLVIIWMPSSPLHSIYCQFLTFITKGILNFFFALFSHSLSISYKPAVPSNLVSHFGTSLITSYCNQSKTFR